MAVFAQLTLRKLQSWPAFGNNEPYSVVLNDLVDEGHDRAQSLKEDYPI